MPQKPDMFRPALYGGLIMAVLSGVPFLSVINCCCCAGVLLGGFLAVFFYTRDMTPGMPPMETNDALKLGAIAGVVGAVGGTILSAVFSLAMGDAGNEAVMGIIRQFEGQIPPEVMDQIETGVGQSGGFGAANILIGFLSSIIIYPIFGLLGGLIGYQVFRNKQPRMPMPQGPGVPPAI
jgi:hypothetical protein